MNQDALDHSLQFIDSWLQLRYEHEEIPGFVVAIAYKGKLVFNQAYGYADLEKETKLTIDHIFRIASHSKTFTATAVMQLQEQGKLRIDDYIADYLPWLQEHADKRWHKVTVRQLLSHGAGVIRDGSESDYWQLEQPFPSESEFKKELLHSELVLDTNAKMKYSNFGYTLLGLLVAEVSGTSYNDYVSRHIVTPLGLKHTAPEYSSHIESQLATGYSRAEVNKTRLPIANVSTYAMSPATGFCSTAEDLCTYFSAQLVGSGKLLDDESKKEMQRVHWHVNRPHQDNHEDYGLGMDIEFLGKRRTIGHGGAFPGYITKTLADPKDELVVTVLTNCIDGPASWMAKSILHVIDYFQENTPTAKPKHDLRKLEGRYMDLWATTDIVVTGEKVVATYPDTWDTLTKPEELIYVNDTTFRIGETDSYGSEGELVRFIIEDGKVAFVNYSGATMWPENEWAKKQASRKQVK